MNKTEKTRFSIRRTVCSNTQHTVVSHRVLLGRSPRGEFLLELSPGFDTVNHKTLLSILTRLSVSAWWWDYFLPGEMVKSDNIEEIHICSIQTPYWSPTRHSTQSSFIVLFQWGNILNFFVFKFHFYAAHPLLYSLRDSFQLITWNWIPASQSCCISLEMHPRVLGEFYLAMQEIFKTNKYYPLCVLLWSCRILKRFQPVLLHTGHSDASLVPCLLETGLLQLVPGRSDLCKWSEYSFLTSPHRCIPSSTSCCPEQWFIPYLLADAYQTPSSSFPSSPKQLDPPPFAIQERYEKTFLSRGTQMVWTSPACI